MQKLTEENFKVEKLTEWGFVSGKDYILGRVDAKLKNIWVEAKRGNDDIYKMLAQIIFTANIECATKSQPIPPYLGCFNQFQGAVIHEDDYYEVVGHPSINWTQTPSKINDETVFLIKSILKTTQIYNLNEFGKQLKQIATDKFNRIDDITASTVVNIYNKWLNTVGQTLQLQDGNSEKLAELKPDCFLADIMIENDRTITNKLLLSRRTIDGELKYVPNNRKALEGMEDISMTNETIYKTFWNKYKRPPKEEFRAVILNRIDLLVSDDNREKNGKFYTPAIWSRVSKEYLAKTFGENWQDEYYIWDCACGTGNLAFGLINHEKVFLSDLEHNVLHAMKDIKFMPDATVFQFDFLNDDWKAKKDGGKLPDSLYEIIKTTPEKLIVYINPPYKEATSSKQTTKTGKAMKDVANTKTKAEMAVKGYGAAGNDLFMQFYYNIYTKIKGCKAGVFSTLKNCNSSNTASFREAFNYKFCGGFICRADDFDHVGGKFPVSFQIWDTSATKKHKVFKFDTLTALPKEECVKDGSKKIYNLKAGMFLNNWFKTNNKSKEEVLCIIKKTGSDFQNQNHIALYKINSVKGHNQNKVTKSNLINSLIYLAVRWVVKAGWLNDRDQLLSPTKVVKKTEDGGIYNEGNNQIFEYEYEKDEVFIANCVAFSLLHKQNYTDWNLFNDSEIALYSSGRNLEVYNMVKNYEFGECAKNLLDIGRQIYTLYYKQIHQNTQNYSVDRKTIWQTLKDNPDFKTLNEQFKTAQQYLADEIVEGMIEYGFYEI